MNGLRCVFVCVSVCSNETSGNTAVLSKQNLENTQAIQVGHWTATRNYLKSNIEGPLGALGKIKAVGIAIVLR